MLEQLPNLPRGVEGLRAVGRVSKDDYQSTFEPMMQGAQREHRRVRLLYELGPEFEGFTPGAAWEDAKLGLRSLELLDGVAVVSDVGWIRDSVRMIAFLMPCPVRAFGGDQREQAVAWLSSLPETGANSHRLLESAGVIVFEVTHALRAADFDALAVTADRWIEAHGELHGVVVHAREFPGWENIAALRRHVRFVRGHHRKVRRVALVTDSKLASFAPRVVGRLIQPDVRRFGDSELESAIAWARAPAAPSATASPETTRRAERPS